MAFWNSSLFDRLVRPFATALYRLLKPSRSALRPQTSGAHALALTPERRVVLVKLRYAPGWRLPGGGRGKDEDIRDAVLRELREEIGMTSHGVVRVSGIAELMIVEDVRYCPRKWSWEVEAIREAALDDLPSDLSSRAAEWIVALEGRL